MTPMAEFGGPLIQNKGIGRFNGVNFVGEVVPSEATIVTRRRTLPLFGLGLVDSLCPTRPCISSPTSRRSTPPARRAGSI